MISNKKRTAIRVLGAVGLLSLCLLFVKDLRTNQAVEGADDFTYNVNVEEDISRDSTTAANNKKLPQISVEKLLNIRMHKIKERCSERQIINKKYPVIKNREFLINEEHNLVWCNIFKSASTTWFYNFLELVGFSEESVIESRLTPVQFARTKAYPRPTINDLRTFLQNDLYTSFIIVREPFERLLSSFKDKIENRGERFYDKIRCRMSGSVRTRRKRACRATFAQFVDFVIKEAESNPEMDEHWQPYNSFCTPCLVNYTYILSFDNLPAEETYFLNKVPGLSSHLSPQKLHASKSNYSEIVPRYYGQLSKPQLDALIDVYREDFILFGYSWDKYYHYVSR